MNAVATSVDRKTMIHIAAELVIVGGVTFWLNSKINGQNEVLVKLHKENAELKARLEKIEQFLYQATGHPPPRSAPPRSERKERRERGPAAPAPGTESGEDEDVMSSSDEDIEI